MSENIETLTAFELSDEALDRDQDCRRCANTYRRCYTVRLAESE